MTRALTAATLLLLSTIVWMVALLIGEGPLTADAAALLGADLVVLGAVAVTGMLLGAARWALRLGIGLGASGLALGALMPIGPLWVAGVAVSGISTALLLARWTDAAVRGRPAAGGPPPESVALSLGLVGLPGVTALLGGGGIEPVQWVVVATALIAALLYTRALPGALAAVRGAVPLALGAAAAVEAAAGRATWPAWVFLAIAFAALGWRRDVRLAVRPLARRGTSVPIPPEMVPPEVRNAAGIDDRGRPRQ